jgi:hypothetical protein
VVAYLEKKNRELSFELFQVQKEQAMEESGDKMRSQLQLPSRKQSKWISHELDNDSIFEYTGIFDKDADNLQLNKVESMPSLDQTPQSILRIPTETHQCSPRTDSTMKHIRSKDRLNVLAVPTTEILDISCKKVKLRLEKRGSTTNDGLRSFEQSKKKKIGIKRE